MNQQRNERRIELILLRRERELTADELAEFNILQEEAKKFRDINADRLIKILDKMRANLKANKEAEVKSLRDKGYDV